MAIKRVSIENFTVFDKLEIDFCDGINIFIGENGTGKTHLLKLLYATQTLHSSNYLYKPTELFGNGFSVQNCCLYINGESSPWTLTIQQGIVQKTESHIQVDIDVKSSSVFIPAKEVLSMSNITRIAEEYKSALNLDVTLTDIIDKAQNMVPDTISEFALDIAQRIEKRIEGIVFFDDKEKTFWIHKDSGSKIPFSSEAEGYRKLGLLWQLVMNKSIKEGTVLLWDEPEANLSRINTPDLVDILFELSRRNVQVFLATHDYNLMKYFSVKKNGSSEVAFFNLYKTGSRVAYEREDDYDLLEHNSIIDANTRLLEAEIERVL